MTKPSLLRHGLRSATIHRACAAALRCSSGKYFAIDAFAQDMWGKNHGRTVSGAGRILAELEQMGLVRKAGKNAFGTALYELTPAGLAKGGVDPHDVVTPVAAVTPARPANDEDLAVRNMHVERASVPPVLAQWTDSFGVAWMVTTAGWFWFDARTGTWTPSNLVHGQSRVR